MLGREKLTELHLRKQALILESKLNRLMLTADCQDLRTAMAGAGAKVKSGCWWLLAPAALAILAGRRFRQPDSTLGRGLSLLGWLQPLYSLWKGFGRKHGSSL